MSLTLRDAQFLCWKTFKKFEARNQKNRQPNEVAADIAQTAQIIEKRVKKPEGTDQPSAMDKQSLAKLLPELLFNAFVLAEYEGIDLENTFMQAIDEYILGQIS